MSPNGKAITNGKRFGGGTSKAIAPAVEETPNFARMTSAERLEYHRNRIAKRLGY